MRTVVLIPFRSDHGRRDQLLEHVTARWEAAGFDVVIGFEDDLYFEDDLSGPFNRSKAINDAARAVGAGDWDVALICDGDTIVPPHQATEAATLAAETGRMVLAFTHFVPLSEKMSSRILDGFAGYWGDPTSGFDWTCSSAIAVPRSLWDAVGGFDEGFVGWGFEDVAFALACDAIGGPRLRVTGPVWHLWHQPAPENDERHPLLLANKERAQAYIDARDGATDQDDHRTRMLAVLRDLGVLPPADAGSSVDGPDLNSAGPNASQDSTPDPTPLKKRTKDQLLAEAARLGVEVPAKATKPDLVALLDEALAR